MPIPNLGSKEQSTVVLIEIITWKAVLAEYGGVSSNAFCVIELGFSTFIPDSTS